MNEATFLRAILEEPDDDLVRLAYADWLMEQGDPDRAARGEFIQIQIRLARREQGVSAAELKDLDHVPALKAREQELMLKYIGTWAEPIVPYVLGVEFRRGFVEVIDTNCSLFDKHHAKLFALAPLRRARFSDPLSQKVASLPRLAWFAELDLSGTNLGNHGLNRLLQAGPLPNLVWLDLSRCYLMDGAMTALAGSAVLGRLRHLDLSNNHLTLEGVRTLIGSRHWGHLRSLALKGNRGIDTNQANFLSATLQGEPDPRLLRTLFQMTSRGDREYTNAHVRDLARRAGNATDSAGVLADGLCDGRPKVRAAASRMLAHLGKDGVAGLPRLVQRLFERDPRVRDLVGPALARMMNNLSGEMNRWLCLLANPIASPEGNVHAVLTSGKLPIGVRDAFAGVCVRRAAWWKHIASGDGPAPAPAPGSYPSDTMSITRHVEELLGTAGAHATRHLPTEGVREIRAWESASRKEAAWLLARLTELLLAEYPRPVEAGKKKC